MHRTGPPRQRSQDQTSVEPRSCLCQDPAARSQECLPCHRASNQDLGTRSQPFAWPVPVPGRGRGDTPVTGPRLKREGLPSWATKPQGANSLTSLPKGVNGRAADNITGPLPEATRVTSQLCIGCQLPDLMTAREAATVGPPARLRSRTGEQPVGCGAEQAAGRPPRSESWKH